MVGLLMEYKQAGPDGAATDRSGRIIIAAPVRSSLMLGFRCFVATLIQSLRVGGDCRISFDVPRSRDEPEP